MEIQRNGTRSVQQGPQEWFTGDVRVEALITTPAPARLQAARVTFAPGARTHWHTHPLGQTLLVTAGKGLAQREGGPVEEIREGDVVFFAPHERHWHGASAESAMTHVAMQERLDGKAVEWAEPVCDEEYGG